MTLSLAEKKVVKTYRRKREEKEGGEGRGGGEGLVRSKLRR